MSTTKRQPMRDLSAFLNAETPKPLMTAPVLAEPEAPPAAEPPAPRLAEEGAPRKRRSRIPSPAPWELLANPREIRQFPLRIPAELHEQMRWLVEEGLRGRNSMQKIVERAIRKEVALLMRQVDED